MNDGTVLSAPSRLARITCRFDIGSLRAGEPRATTAYHEFGVTLGVTVSVERGT
jgi:hypothetical protein